MRREEFIGLCAFPAPQIKKAGRQAGRPLRLRNGPALLIVDGSTLVNHPRYDAGAGGDQPALCQDLQASAHGVPTDIKALHQGAFAVQLIAKYDGTRANLMFKRLRHAFRVGQADRLNAVRLSILFLLIPKGAKDRSREMLTPRDGPGRSAF